MKPLAARRSIARTALLLLPVQIVLRAVEPALPIVCAYWFGRGDATDVYYFAWALFALAGSLVFSLHQDSALLPVLLEEKQRDPSALPRLRGAVLSYTWLIGAALSVVVGGGALIWFRIRYDDASFALSSRMVAPFCAFLIVMSTRTFFNALCSVERHFVVQPIASFLGMCGNLTLLATLHSKMGIACVPLGALVGEVISASVLAIFVTRVLKLKIELCFERSTALRTFARLVGSEVGGNAVTRVNPVVDQLMAGLTAVAGGGTMLRYSGDVAMLPTSILQAALLPVLISHLADDFARRDLVTIRRTTIRALLWVCGLLLASTVLLYLIRSPLLRLVFLHGQMDEAGVDRMAALLPYHLVGLAPFGALLVLSRAHVAIKNGGIMIAMGVFNAGANALFNLVLIRFLGLEGLALSTSCVQIAVAIVFWFLLESKLTRLRNESAAAEPA